MSEVTLEEVVTDGSTVRFEFGASGRVRRFFTGDDFFAEYDVSVETVPEGVLTVAWLANVCPIAWANGATVSVPTVDRQFLTALESVERTYRELYPEFVQGGEVRADEVVELGTAGSESKDDADEVGLMFSGGIDSLATFVRHRDEDPLLLSVHGFDVQLHRRDAWERKRDVLRSFGAERGLENRFVAANLTTFQDMFMVNSSFKRYLDSNWFDSVQAGLGLLGLCAPVAYREGLDQLYMAGSYSAEYPHTVSFNPRIVDEVAWTPTTVVHDGWALTRQDKVNLVAEYAGTDDRTLSIHTCLQSEVGNCNDCEKCARTVAGLLLAGADPNEFGYDVDARRLATFRERLERGEWEFGEGDGLFWTDIQDSIDPEREYPVEGADAFFEWLAELDVDELVETEADLRDRIVRTVGRHTPYPVYATMARAYVATRELYTSG